MARGLFLMVFLTNTQKFVNLWKVCYTNVITRGTRDVCPPGKREVTEDGYEF